MTGEQLIAALGTHVDTWLEVILENLASEEAAERHGRDGTGESSFCGKVVGLKLATHSW